MGGPGPPEMQNNLVLCPYRLSANLVQNLLTYLSQVA
jgi:hypothetical protein